jgi:hypothetical protein
MKFFKLSNGFVINLAQIATITRPYTKDPYNKTYGKQYEIIMSSSCKYDCYDSVNIDPRMTLNLCGFSVLKYDDLMKMIGMNEEKTIDDVFTCRITD